MRTLRRHADRACFKPGVQSVRMLNFMATAFFKKGRSVYELPGGDGERAVCVFSNDDLQISKAYVRAGMYMIGAVGPDGACSDPVHVNDLPEPNTTSASTVAAAAAGLCGELETVVLTLADNSVHGPIGYDLKNGQGGGQLHNARFDDKFLIP